MELVEKIARIAGEVVGKVLKILSKLLGLG